MPNIGWIEDKDARDQLADVYKAYFETNPHKDRIPGILKCFSRRPDFLRQVIEFSNTVHFSDGHLNRRTKEMIATLVSGLNQCPY